MTLVEGYCAECDSLAPAVQFNDDCVCASCLRDALDVIDDESSTTLFVGRDEDTGDIDASEVRVSFERDEEPS